MAAMELQNPQTHYYVCSDSTMDKCEICGHKRAEHPINQDGEDPRGSGAVEEMGILEQGQPNIIDYSSKEPFLYQAGENSSHEYPGKIITNNEPERGSTANDFNNYHDGQTAETGKSQPLNYITQPGLPTGSPGDTGEIEIDDHAKHGDNFNTKVDFKSDGIEVNDDNNKNQEESGKFSEEPQEEELTQSGVLPEEELLYQQIISSTNNSQTENTSQLSNESLFHPTGEKSDTGDDLSRTGPEGNKPEENNDATHYAGTSDTKLNVATGIEIEEEHAKQIHDVDGTIPELREDDNAESLKEAIEINIDGEKKKTTLQGFSEAKNEKKSFLEKIYPHLKRAGILTISFSLFQKMMEEKNYKQTRSMFQSIPIYDIMKVTITKEEKKQIDKDLLLSTPKLVTKKYKRFKYNSGNIPCPICKPLDGMEFADDDPNRPIVPNENLGSKVYNTHTHCKCDNIEFEKLIPIDQDPKSDVAQSRAAAASLRERKEITSEYLDHYLKH